MEKKENVREKREREIDGEERERAGEARKGNRWRRERTCGKYMERERARTDGEEVAGVSCQERDWEEKEGTGKQIGKREREKL